MASSEGTVPDSMLLSKPSKSSIVMVKRVVGICVEERIRLALLEVIVRKRAEDPAEELTVPVN